MGNNIQSYFIIFFLSIEKLLTDYYCSHHHEGTNITPILQAGKWSHKD